MTDSADPRSPIAPALADQQVARPWVAQGQHLQAVFATGSMASGIVFVDRIVAAAERRNHHPDILLRYGTVLLTLNTWTAGGITRFDLDLAAEISAIAAELELPPADSGPAWLEIAIDALDIPRVKEFWRSTLGLRANKTDPVELADPTGKLPTLWFQQMDQPRRQRNRVHLDVWVPRDEIDDRIATALAAGGRLVSDADAPSFWVLADPEGNEVCLCTSAERE
ncbi:VOC family protein [Millisia brevis]|uniref:VOC family protein n=1 Tax=Millisia brevis TaxID=264148 RepID=UPI0008330EE9|nr:VOC family protein [Millisia brevis]